MTTDSEQRRTIDELTAITEMIAGLMIPVDDGAQTYRITWEDFMKSIGGIESVTATGTKITITTTSEKTYTVDVQDSSKQDKLSWDSSPTEGSSNAISSGAVYTAVKENTDAISEETERATEAEKENSSAISDETDRAVKVEEQLSESISEERERAKGIEDTLTQDLSTVRSRTLYSIGRNPTTGHMALIYHE